LGEIGRSVLKLFVFAPTTPPKQPPLAPRRWVTLSWPGNGNACGRFFTSLRASPLRSEVPQPSGTIVVVGQKSVTQDKFPQPPRRCSGASAASLALGRGRIMCGRFLRWIPRAIPNFVASSPAVSELYWGKKALHVCMKIANLGPRLGRSTPCTLEHAWRSRRVARRRGGLAREGVGS
jgi:hypothetical protein